MDIFLNNLYFLEIRIKNFLLRSINLFFKLFFYFIYSNIKHKDKYIIIQRFGSLGDIVTSIKSVLMIIESYKNHKIIIFHSKNLYSNFDDLKNILPPDIQFIEYDSHEKSSLYSIGNNLKKLNIQKWFILSQELANFFYESKQIFFANYCGSKRVYFADLQNSFFFKKSIKNIQYLYESNRLATYLNKYDVPNLNKKINHYMNFDQSKFKSFDEIIFPNGNLGMKTAIIFISANKKPNIWNYKNYSKIILQLISYNFKIILLGTKNDIDQINLLKSSLDIKNGDLIDLTGNTSFEDLFYICQMVDLSISNDTGIIHITNLFNIRTFAIFSSRDYHLKWFPDNAIIFRKDINCSPCFLDICPYENKCINSITSEKVINKLNEFN